MLKEVFRKVGSLAAGLGTAAQIASPFAVEANNSPTKLPADNNASDQAKVEILDELPESVTGSNLIIKQALLGESSSDLNDTPDTSPETEILADRLVNGGIYKTNRPVTLRINAAEARWKNNEKPIAKGQMVKVTPSRLGTVFYYNPHLDAKLVHLSLFSSNGRYVGEGWAFASDSKAFDRVDRKSWLDWLNRLRPSRKKASQAPAERSVGYPSSRVQPNSTGNRQYM